MRLVRGKPRGILRPAAIEQKFALGRYEPAVELAALVEHYWTVHWDLRGEPPYLQETLPFPCAHLVFDAAAARIWGVVRAKFSTVLEDQGSVFGVRFRPGGLRAFCSMSVARITDRVVAAETIFGDACAPMVAALRDGADDAALGPLVDATLLGREPNADTNIALVGAIVDRIIADRTLIRVEAVADYFALSRRSLQRLFHEYVGVGPKWVISRYRLQEAAERLAGPEPPEPLALALELGYFDQAHFIKEFKAIVGEPPAEYARSLGRPVPRS